jgi:SAM-dependent methyltransferase
MLKGHIKDKIIFNYYKFLFPRLFPKKNIFECNLCGWKGKSFVDFNPGHGVTQKKLTCPDCYSQPRNRLSYFFLKNIIPTNKALNVLHISPEYGLTKMFKSYPLINYTSIDINPKKALRKEDITGLSFKDSSFDLIFCSHVLEHVPNDKKAISEIYRVLKKNGTAIIIVPLYKNQKKTYEDFSITNPKERAKAFGQWDHVRICGQDYVKRLKKEGFKAKIENYSKKLDKNIIKRFGILDEQIYICKK